VIYKNAQKFQLFKKNIAY